MFYIQVKLFFFFKLNLLLEKKKAREQEMGDKMDSYPNYCFVWLKTMFWLKLLVICFELPLGNITDEGRQK